MHIIRGRYGMWQIHFINKKSAAEFLDRLQTLDFLQSLEIYKAKTSEEKCQTATQKTCFIVRLTSQQLPLIGMRMPNLLASTPSFTYPNHATAVASNVALHYESYEVYHNTLAYLNKVGIKYELAMRNCSHNDNKQCLMVELKNKDFTMLAEYHSEKEYYTIQNDLQNFIAHPELLTKQTANLLSLFQFETGSALLIIIFSTTKNFKHFLTKIENKVLITALLMTPLSLLRIAFKHGLESFQLVLAKLDQSTLDQLLRERTTDGTTFQQMALITPFCFEFIIEKASSELIQEELLQFDSDGRSILNRMCSKFDSALFQRLLSKVPQEIIEFLLLKSHVKNNTLLHYIFLKQNDATVNFIFARFNLDILTTALINKGADFNPLETLAHYQSAATVAKVLSYFNKEVDAWNKYFTENFYDFFSALKAFALYQPATNIIKFLSLFNEELLLTLFFYLKKAIHTETDLHAYLALNLKLEAVPDKGYYFAQYLKLWGKAILETKDKFVFLETIEEKVIPTKTEQAVLSLFKSGDILIKIIQDEKGERKGWKDFLEHFKNYNKRQHIRDPDKPLVGYKVIHIPSDEKKSIYATSQIIQLGDKTHTERVKHYHKMKKSPATLISKHLHTALFGHHDPCRNLVGLAFDRKLCKFKMMLTQDRGTYYREWIDSHLMSVKRYAENIQHISYRDWDTFKNAIDAQPYAVNEVLAEFVREALQAIVIARDTPFARKSALERHEDLKKILKRDIPIIFYDAIGKNVLVYSRLAQSVDTIRFAWQTFTPNKLHHSILLKTLNKISGQPQVQLLQCYYLMKAYVSFPAHRGYLLNSSFYHQIHDLFKKVKTIIKKFSISLDVTVAKEAYVLCQKTFAAHCKDAPMDLFYRESLMKAYTIQEDKIPMDSLNAMRPKH